MLLKSCTISANVGLFSGSSSHVLAIISLLCKYITIYTYSSRLVGKSSYILPNALPSAFMEYKSWGESWVANMRQSQALYLSQDSHQVLHISYKWSGSTLSGLLYFSLTNLNTMKFNILSMRLLHKWMVFFDENVSMY